MSVLKRFLGYADKMFALYKLLEEIPLERQKEIIPSWDVVFSSFMMCAARMGSLNVLEGSSPSSFWKRVLRCRMPCADEIAWASERIPIEALREVLYSVYRKARRNKVFAPFHGFRLLAVDGHELFSSYARCCSECLERNLEVHGEKRIQYYHRIAMAQLITQEGHFIIDIELQRKGEDEVSCALRLIQRLLSRFPRLFDIVTVDALYAQAPFVNALLEKEKDVVVVLKDERRELYKDATGLFASEAPNKTISSGNKNIQQWDIEEFMSWDKVTCPVRVVRSFEETRARKRREKTWKYETTHKDWIWVTTLSQKKADTEAITAIGHKRWMIENEGFNHLRLWHFNHAYHHYPGSLLFFMFLTLIAFNIFQLMLQRNFKPSRRNGRSKTFLSRCMLAEILVTVYPP